MSPPLNFNCPSNLYGTDDLGDSLYPKTPTVFGIKDTRRFHNATVEESGSKVRLFNAFIEVANHGIVALWPMQDSSCRQQRALRRATTEQLDIEGPSITNCFQLVFRGNLCIFGLSVSIKTEYFNFESIYNLSKMYRSYLQSIRPWSSHL